MDNSNDNNNNNNNSNSPNSSINQNTAENTDNSLSDILAEQQALLYEYSQNFSFSNTINLNEIISKEGKKNEPSWNLLMFEWMTPKLQNLFFKNLNYKKVLTDSNIYYLEGLIYEYGLFGAEQSYEKALEKYIQSLKLDNQYCLYKFFFILTNEDSCQNFGLEKSWELALIFLIKSCAYNESYLDINRIEPIYKLNSILNAANKNIETLFKVVENFPSYLNEKSKNSVLNVKCNYLEVKYLNAFLLLSFPSRVENLRDALKRLESIAEEHYEACFKLACIYYSPMYKEYINKDVPKSLQFFNYLQSKNYPRSLCSFYKVCEEQKIVEKLQPLIILAKELRGYSSHFYANYICRDRLSLEKNRNRILKYFFKSLLYGNLISVVIIFEILTKLYISKFVQGKNKDISDNLESAENKNWNNNKIMNFTTDKSLELEMTDTTENLNESNKSQTMKAIHLASLNEDINYNSEHDYMNYFFKSLGINLRHLLSLIYEFVSIKKKEDYINNILDYDVLVLFYQIHAYFYYKGYMVEKNIPKAIQIMEETFKNEKSIKCYRKIFYYLAKSYKKIGNMGKYNFYMKKSFDVYILLSEFPYHHFIVGKTFLNGIKDVPKNLDYALHFFKAGYNYNENNFFINVLYSEKCHNYLLKNKDLLEFINKTVLNSSKIISENFIDNEKICIICYSNFRQIRHSKCKHKLICLLCYDKMQNKNQCPFCKQISEADNEFEI